MSELAFVGGRRCCGGSILWTVFMLMRLRIEQETVLDRFFHGIGSQLIRPVLGTAGAVLPGAETMK